MTNTTPLTTVIINKNIETVAINDNHVDVGDNDYIHCRFIALPFTPDTMSGVIRLISSNIYRFDVLKADNDYKKVIFYALLDEDDILG